MKILKQYTAIKLSTETVDNTVEVKMQYGKISGPYYSQNHPEEIHNSEEEALEYAYKIDKWATWLIVPVIRFDNF